MTPTLHIKQEYSW